MRRVAGWGLLALTLAMVLGVGSAGGRTLVFPSTVTVQVIGPGKVKSAPSGINCGNGNTDCYAAFSTGPSVDLNPIDQATGRSTTGRATVGPRAASIDGSLHNYDAVAVFAGLQRGRARSPSTTKGRDRQGGQILCGATGGDPYPGDPPTRSTPALTLTGLDVLTPRIPDNRIPGCSPAGQACEAGGRRLHDRDGREQTITATWVSRPKSPRVA